MTTRKNYLSIRVILIIIFFAALLVSYIVISGMFFSNWLASAEQATQNISQDLGGYLSRQLENMMHTPEHINEVNYKIIQNNILNLSDDVAREQFFAGVLQAHGHPIYSVSYGNEEGEYYGARRYEKDFVEIIRNDAQTDGNLWYYAVNDDLTAGERILDAGKFDPRTRAWYTVVKETGAPSHSPVYKHFIMNDLTISAARPVFNKDGSLKGVFGSHMLLNDVGTFLAEAMRSYNGIAVIAEKQSGLLIANSIGVENFTVLPDKTLVRFGVEDLHNINIQESYRIYQNNPASSFMARIGQERFFISVQELILPGVDWLIVSAIPENILIKAVYDSMHTTGWALVLLLILFLFVFAFITNKFMRPVYRLVDASERLAAGDLKSRVDVERDDEIGIISSGFNKVADAMQHLVGNLEANVAARTEDLLFANTQLQANKNRLQLILDSAAEGVYGIDLDGNCTFCNVSCLHMMGYDNAEELLGKNMHALLHHSYRDGSLMQPQDCKILKAVMRGEAVEDEDEVFWRKDGSFFDVSYHAHPQIHAGHVVGAVVTFTDITERKKRENEIEYLSCHDHLTGLHNRRCFEDKRSIIDTPENLPLSVVFADINGLKMTNDIFGHAAGDELIKKSAEILRTACREGDALARVGGDEFIILLPKTTRDETENVIARIRAGFAKARVAAVRCSISLGCDTKTRSFHSLEEVMANAENAMYKDKTANRKTINADLIDTVIETLHTKSPDEKRHSQGVAALCEAVGKEMGRSAAEIAVLRRAGYLHDIGKIVFEEDLLTKISLTDEEQEKMQQHVITGYRILNLFDDTLDLAEVVYAHHERFDGTGYPKGVKGDEIPLMSRIIAVAERYERVVHRTAGTPAESKATAIAAVREGAGSRYDPIIAGLFADLMENAPL